MFNYRRLVFVRVDGMEISLGVAAYPLESSSIENRVCNILDQGLPAMRFECGRRVTIIPMPVVNHGHFEMRPATYIGYLLSRIL